tara:strand:+ start:126 stop:374 length:249 start_codon:yes stop_codon:yes gene_type:complete
MYNGYIKILKTTHIGLHTLSRHSEYNVVPYTPKEKTYKVDKGYNVTHTKHPIGTDVNEIITFFSSRKTLQELWRDKYIELIE